MKYNTRFNPTISGDSLHLGHLYVALVNYYEGIRSGGKFIVRLDDTQEKWNHLLGKEAVSRFSDMYIEQLDKFMYIDKVEKQSEMPSIEEIVGDNPFLEYIPSQMWEYDQIAEWIPYKDLLMYPYTARLTCERVVWDYYEEINWLIRGEDLVTESSFYCFMVDALRLPRMRQTYLPRLKSDDGGQLLKLNVSKSLGNYRLSDLLPKLGVEGIIETLKISCLRNLDHGFIVDNIKSDPMVIQC
jgi:hypothetical protein